MSTKKQQPRIVHDEALLARDVQPHHPWPGVVAERWPWVTSWGNEEPPWVRRADSLTKAERCLRWLWGHPEDLPAVFAFFGVAVAHGIVTHYPPGRVLIGSISEELAGLYPKARAYEVLSFLHCLSGNAHWQRVREMLATPNPEAIARAWAIVSSGDDLGLLAGPPPKVEAAEPLPLGERLRRAFPGLGEHGDLLGIACTLSEVDNATGEPRLWTDKAAVEALGVVLNTWKKYARNLEGLGVIVDRNKANPSSRKQWQINLLTDK